jgi:N-acetyl-gamma-glutamyl-phosphate reductase
MTQPADAVRVAVVGATGYAGAELVRYLARHPRAQLAAVTSEQSAGKSLAEVLPSVRGKLDLTLETFEATAIAAKATVAFTALPQGASATGVANLLEKGCRVVDIGADFRLRDANEHARVYGVHPVPALLRESVYGLTEYCRPALPSARLVANPGCYPTAALLGLLPLVERNLIEPDGIVIDAKSGVTGAGRTVAAEYLFAEVDDNLGRAEIGQHRHAPEIEQELRPFIGSICSVTFVPHLLPSTRDPADVRNRAQRRHRAFGEAFRARYASERFIVLSGSVLPRFVTSGTNDCALGWTLDGAGVP